MTSGGQTTMEATKLNELTGRQLASAHCTESVGGLHATRVHIGAFVTI